MRRPIWWVVALGLFCGACEQPMKRLNAPPHGDSTNKSEMHATYAHMVDNALLEDMTISDLHFIPHRPLLNSLGEVRLRRLASLMEEYGGVLRYNTDLDDGELLNARADAVVAFLARAGIDTQKEVLRRDLPGGRGMPADEAIMIKARMGEKDKGADAGTEGGLFRPGR
jgi:hypothetical protein